ncbi:MAG: 2Fe-2S iron-sulfur cluster-binding protein [Pseudobdellovibrionaceae bacterium]
MPQVKFIKNKPAFEISPETPLMEALTNQGIPVASSCGGEAVCCKCTVKIIEGRENLSPENSEEKFLREQFDLAPDMRVSCQTKVLGDVTIDTNYW